MCNLNKNHVFLYRMKEKTNDEWFETLNGATFANGPVNNMEQVFKDKQVISCL